VNHNTTLCICDFETTGVDTTRDQPIEIGCVFVNHELEVLAEYEALLKDPLRLGGFVSDGHWTNRAVEAYHVHKIPAAALDAGASWQRAASRILALCDTFRPPLGRVVLTSDNIQFEWHYMRSLFAVADLPWPFHYCGWDTGLLLEMLNLAELPMEHRALPDARIILDNILAARTLLRERKDQ